MPPRSRSRRWTGLAGLGLTLILIPAIATETAGPDSSSSAQRVASQFASARTVLLISSALFLVAMVFALAFVLGLSSLAAPRDGMSARLGSAAGLLGIALLTVYAVSLAAIAATIPELREHQSLVYAVFRVISAIDDGSGLFIAVFIGALLRPLAHAGLSPRWLTNFGMLAASVRAVGVLDITTLGAWPFGPFMVAGTLLCIAWLLLASISLLRAQPGGQH